MWSNKWYCEICKSKQRDTVVSFWSDGGLKIKKNLGKCQESFPWKNVFLMLKKNISLSLSLSLSKPYPTPFNDRQDKLNLAPDLRSHNNCVIAGCPRFTVFGKEILKRLNRIIGKWNDMFVLVYIDSRFLYASCRKTKISTIARCQKVSSQSRNFVISTLPPSHGCQKKETKDWRQISSNFQMYKSI